MVQNKGPAHVIPAEPDAAFGQTSSAQSCASWNSLLLWARRTRGPRWDYSTAMYQVDRGSPEFYMGVEPAPVSRPPSPEQAQTNGAPAAAPPYNTQAPQGFPSNHSINSQAGAMAAATGMAYQQALAANQHQYQQAGYPSQAALPPGQINLAQMATSNVTQAQFQSLTPQQQQQFLQQRQLAQMLAARGGMPQGVAPSSLGGGFRPS